MPRAQNPKREQVRTERISVLTTPVIKDKIEKIAFIQRKTLNELINDIFKAYIRKHADDLKKYNDTFKEDDQES